MTREPKATQPVPELTPDQYQAAVARLEAELREYQPCNGQERADRKLMLHYLGLGADCFDRTSLAHFTCSAWTVDPTRTETLMVYHNIYDSWSWIGGHADGDPRLAQVAARELQEETGIAHASLVPCGIYSLETLTVDGHEKHGAYVSSHLHLNVTYLFVADPALPLRSAPAENRAVSWVKLTDVVPLSSEPWIRERIYRKLIERLDTVPADCWQAALTDCARNSRR
ncbi:MAG: NUDIX hydrolase [Eggerthellaceae bacterium]|jgi:8-oxo-dGTP pyrophosphatase MutT (NUDIX family)